jgi:glycerophosphoryl diester phosphodiesterase
VELDVRLSRDDEAVLWHDPKLPDGTVVARSGRGSLATLDEALEVCRGKIVNVEVKADVPRRFALLRAVARSIARARDVEVVMSSFDPAMVLGMVALSPQTPRAILVGDRTARLSVALPRALRRFVVAAHVQDGALTAGVVERVRAMGLRVVAWTVNDAVRARALEKMGVEWLITDQPASLR